MKKVLAIVMMGAMTLPFVGCGQAKIQQLEQEKAQLASEKATLEHENAELKSKIEVAQNALSAVQQPVAPEAAPAPAAPAPAPAPAKKK